MSPGTGPPANARDNTVTRLNRDSGVIGTYQVAVNPQALVFDGQNMWVANQGDDTVTVLSLDGVLLDTFNVGKAPWALAYDGKDLWVANQGESTVTKIVT